MNLSKWPARAEMRVMHSLQNFPGGAYGLQLVEDSDGEIKRGSVYVLLARLEDKGFVKVMPGNQVPPSGGLPRPKYQLTAEGIRVLKAADAIGMVYA